MFLFPLLLRSLLHQLLCAHWIFGLGLVHLVLVHLVLIHLVLIHLGLVHLVLILVPIVLVLVPIVLVLVPIVPIRGLCRLVLVLDVLALLSLALTQPLLVVLARSLPTACRIAFACCFAFAYCVSDNSSTK